MFAINVSNNTKHRHSDYFEGPGIIKNNLCVLYWYLFVRCVKVNVQNDNFLGTT